MLLLPVVVLANARKPIAALPYPDDKVLKAQPPIAMLFAPVAEPLKVVSVPIAILDATLPPPLPIRNPLIDPVTPNEPVI